MPDCAQLKVKMLRGSTVNHDLKYATPGSAGIDLRAAFDEGSILIKPGERVLIPTGIAVEIPQGMAGFIFSRSGLGAKHGLTVAQGVGVVDSDYRGEVCVWLLNTSPLIKSIMRGDRVAQLVLMPVFQAAVTYVADLSETERGAGGFGSTGRA